jgi:hypothetical protein
MLLIIRTSCQFQAIGGAIALAKSVVPTIARVLTRETMANGLRPDRRFNHAERQL